MSATITYSDTLNRFADSKKITLDKINQGITGGGLGGSQEVYIGRDPAAPDDPTKPALNYASGGGPMTQWDVANQLWV